MKLDLSTKQPIAPDTCHGATASARLTETTDAAALKKAARAGGFRKTGDHYEHPDGSWVTLQQGQLVRGFQGVQFQRAPSDLLHLPTLAPAQVANRAIHQAPERIVGGDGAALTAKLQQLGFAPLIPGLYFSHPDGSWVALIHDTVVRGLHGHRVAGATPPSKPNGKALATRADVLRYGVVQPSLEDSFLAVAQFRFLVLRDDVHGALLTAAGFSEVTPRYFEHADGSWLAFLDDGSTFCGKGQLRLATTPYSMGEYGAVSSDARHLGYAISAPNIAALQADAVATNDQPLLNAGFLRDGANFWRHPDQSFVGRQGGRLFFGIQTSPFMGPPQTGALRVVNPTSLTPEFWGLSNVPEAKQRELLAARGFQEGRRGFFSKSDLWATIDHGALITGSIAKRCRFAHAPDPTQLPARSPTVDDRFLAVAYASAVANDDPQRDQKLRAYGLGAAPGQSSPAKLYVASDGSWLAIDGEQRWGGQNQHRLEPLPVAHFPSTDASSPVANDAARFPVVQASWTDATLAIARSALWNGTSLERRQDLLQHGFVEKNLNYFEHADGSWVAYTDGRAAIGKGRTRFSRAPTPPEQLKAEHPYVVSLDLAVAAPNIARLSATDLATSDAALIAAGFQVSGPGLWSHADGSAIAISGGKTHAIFQGSRIVGLVTPADLPTATRLPLAQCSAVWGLQSLPSSELARALLQRGFVEPRPGFFRNGRLWCEIGSDRICGNDTTRFAQWPNPDTLPVRPVDDSVRSLAVADAQSLNPTDAGFAAAMADLGFSATGALHAHSDGSWAAVYGDRLILGVGDARFAEALPRLPQAGPDANAPTPADIAGMPKGVPAGDDFWLAALNVTGLAPQTPTRNREILLQAGFVERRPDFFEHPDGSWFARTPTIVAGKPGTTFMRLACGVTTNVQGLGQDRPRLMVWDPRLAALTPENFAESRPVLETLGFTELWPGVWRQADTSWVALLGARVQRGMSTGTLPHADLAQLPSTAPGFSPSALALLGLDSDDRAADTLRARGFTEPRPGFFIIEKGPWADLNAKICGAYSQRFDAWPTVDALPARAPTATDRWLAVAQTLDLRADQPDIGAQLTSLGFEIYPPVAFHSDGSWTAILGNVLVRGVDGTRLMGAIPRPPQLTPVDGAPQLADIAAWPVVQPTFEDGALAIAQLRLTNKPLANRATLDDSGFVEKSANYFEHVDGSWAAMTDNAVWLGVGGKRLQSQPASLTQTGTFTCALENCQGSLGRLPPLDAAALGRDDSALTAAGFQRVISRFWRHADGGFVAVVGNSVEYGRNERRLRGDPRFAARPTAALTPAVLQQTSDLWDLDGLAPEATRQTALARGFVEKTPGFLMRDPLWISIGEPPLFGVGEQRLAALTTPAQVPARPANEDDRWSALGFTTSFSAASADAAIAALGFRQENAHFFHHDDGSWLARWSGELVRGRQGERLTTLPAPQPQPRNDADAPTVAAVMAYPAVPPTMSDSLLACANAGLTTRLPAPARRVLIEAGFTERTPLYFEHTDGSWIGLTDNAITFGAGKVRFNQMPMPLASWSARQPVPADLQFAIADPGVAALTPESLAKDDRAVRKMGFVPAGNGLWLHPDGSFVAVYQRTLRVGVNGNVLSRLPAPNAFGLAAITSAVSFAPVVVLWTLPADVAQLPSALVQLGFQHLGRGVYTRGSVWVSLQGGQVHCGDGMERYPPFPPSPASLPKLPGGPEHRFLALAQVQDLTPSDPLCVARLKDEGFSAVSVSTAQSEVTLYCHHDGSWLMELQGKVIRGAGAFRIDGNLPRPPPPTNERAARTVAQLRALPAATATFEDNFHAVGQVRWVHASLAENREQFLKLGFVEKRAGVFEHPDGSWVAAHSGNSFETGIGDRHLNPSLVGIDGLAKATPIIDHLALACAGPKLATLTPRDLADGHALLVELGFKSTSPNLWVHADGSFVSCHADGLVFGLSQAVFSRGQPAYRTLTPAPFSLDVMCAWKDCWDIDTANLARAAEQLQERGFRQAKPGFFDDGNRWVAVERGQLIAGAGNNSYGVFPAPGTIPRLPANRGHSWFAVAATASLRPSPTIASELLALGFQPLAGNLYAHGDGSWVYVGESLMRGVYNVAFSAAPAPPPPEVAHDQLPPDGWAWWVANTTLGTTPILANNAHGRDQISARGYLLTYDIGSEERWHHPDGSWVRFLATGGVNVGWQKWPLGELPFQRR